LTDLSLWPLTDEAMNGHYAMELSEKGKVQLLYGFSAMPPLYDWLLGLFFKIFGVSLRTLWLLPAVISSLTVIFTYWAGRAFFSRSFAVLFAGSMAFSFWPLYAGRFSAQGGLALCWEMLVLAVLGWFWKVPEGKRTTSAFLLGVCSGIGFYTYTSWPVVAVPLTLVVFLKLRTKSSIDWKGFLLFLIPQGLLFVPMLNRFFFGGGYLPYVLQNPFQGFRGFNDLMSFFWGSPLPPNLFAYRPFWGGLLNPLLGALCFLGVFYCLKIFPKPFRWMGLGLFVTLVLPGSLTGGLDMYRVIQVLPMLLFFIAVGLVCFWNILPKNGKLPGLIAVLVISICLDLFHLFGIYHSIWTHPKDNWFASKSVERMRAYDILEEANAKAGPGFVLSDLVPDIYDQSLSLAAYGFNVEQNPKFHPADAKWVALLTNIHYQDALTKEFPEARSFWLASDVERPDGGLMLVIIPLPSSHPEELNRWIGVDLAMRGMLDEVYDNRDWKDRGPIIRDLFQLYPLVKGDRFLESCFFEKIAENEYGDRHLPEQIGAMRQALQRGIPTAHLYNALGALDWRRGDIKQARMEFQEALRCRPNHTSAGTALQLMDEQERTGKVPVP